MTERIRVGVLFGGRSCEHEVSVTSARSMVAAMDAARYDVTLIGIAKDGRWLVSDQAERLLSAPAVAGDDLVPVLLDYPGSRELIAAGGETGRVLRGAVDVVFPLLHGPYGEDGTVQGLLELAGIAYVGAGVVGSAVGMDKEMTRRVLRAERLPQVDYVVVRRERWEREPQGVIEELAGRFAFPVFVKPVSLGSSVGVTRAGDADALAAGIDAAAEFDYKVMVEAAAADCREVEVAVLGNETPAASIPGEIEPAGDFYDYDAKYVDDTAGLIIPARIGERTAIAVRELALDVFRAVEGAGLARVDFFVNRADESILVNEINTMPGFTPISMYPKLWEASGIPYGELIDRLIELALERHRDRQRVRTSL